MNRYSRTRYNYAIYDGFTSRPLAGTPLALVFDADGLDDAAMQRLAREFNLSETAFVLKPEKEAHVARLRIFTPASELPFASHPTIGASIALARRRQLAEADNLQPHSVMMLEEGAGDIRAVVQLADDGEAAGLPNSTCRRKRSRSAAHRAAARLPTRLALPSSRSASRTMSLPCGTSGCPMC